MKEQLFHGKDYTCIWEDTVDEKNKLWQVRLKIYFEKTGEYHEEFHQERGYKIDSIKIHCRRQVFSILMFIMPIP